MRLYGLLTTVLLGLILQGCASPVVLGDGVDPRDGRRYLDALSQAIVRSDKIIVTEHSFELDLYDSESQENLIGNDVVYATRELDQRQKSRFIRTIGNLDAATRTSFPMCIFAPHHAVQFYQQGALVSTMQICFQCGEVRWDGFVATPPWSMYEGLKTFITSIGLEPERDWAALAKQHVQ